MATPSKTLAWNQRLRDLLGGFRGHRNGCQTPSSPWRTRQYSPPLPCATLPSPLMPKAFTREPLESLHAWRLERGSRVKPFCIRGEGVWRYLSLLVDFGRFLVGERLLPLSECPLPFFRSLLHLFERGLILRQLFRGEAGCGWEASGITSYVPQPTPYILDSTPSSPSAPHVFLYSQSPYSRLGADQIHLRRLSRLRDQPTRRGFAN